MMAVKINVDANAMDQFATSDAADRDARLVHMQSQMAPEPDGYMVGMLKALAKGTISLADFPLSVQKRLHEVTQQEVPQLSPEQMQQLMPDLPPDTTQALASQPIDTSDITTPLWNAEKTLTPQAGDSTAKQVAFNLAEAIPSLVGLGAATKTPAALGLMTKGMEGGQSIASLFGAGPKMTKLAGELGKDTAVGGAVTAPMIASGANDVYNQAIQGGASHEDALKDAITYMSRDTLPMLAGNTLAGYAALNKKGVLPEGANTISKLFASAPADIALGAGGMGAQSYISAANQANSLGKELPDKEGLIAGLTGAAMGGAFTGGIKGANKLTDWAQKKLVNQAEQDITGTSGVPSEVPPTITGNTDAERMQAYTAKQEADRLAAETEAKQAADAMIQQQDGQQTTTPTTEQIPPDVSVTPQPNGEALPLATQPQITPENKPQLFAQRQDLARQIQDIDTRLPNIGTNNVQVRTELAGQRKVLQDQLDQLPMVGRDRVPTVNGSREILFDHELNTDQQRAVDLMNVLGKKVRFFVGDKPNDFDGFYKDDNSKTLWLNSTTDQKVKPYIYVAGHEFGHFLHTNSATLQSRLAKVVGIGDPEIAKFRQGLYNDRGIMSNYKTREAVNKHYTDHVVKSEMISTILGTKFMDIKFWDGLKTKDKNLYTTLRNMAKRYIDTLRTKLSIHNSGGLTDGTVEDISRMFQDDIAHILDGGDISIDRTKPNGETISNPSDALSAFHSAGQELNHEQEIVKAVQDAYQPGVKKASFILPILKANTKKYGNSFSSIVNKEFDRLKNGEVMPTTQSIPKEIPKQTVNPEPKPIEKKPSELNPNIELTVKKPTNVQDTEDILANEYSKEAPHETKGIDGKLTNEENTKQDTPPVPGKGSTIGDYVASTEGVPQYDKEGTLTGYKLEDVSKKPNEQKQSDMTSKEEKVPAERVEVAKGKYIFVTHETDGTYTARQLNGFEISKTRNYNAESIPIKNSLSKTPAYKYQRKLSATGATKAEAIAKAKELMGLTDGNKFTSENVIARDMLLQAIDGTTVEKAGAKQKLVQWYDHLIRHIAEQAPERDGITTADHYQEGVIGFLKAVDTFMQSPDIKAKFKDYANPTKTMSLVTAFKKYATPQIKNEIFSNIAKNKGISAKDLSDLMKLRSESAKLGEKASLKELADATGFNEKRVKDLQDIRDSISIDAEVKGSKEENLTIKDTLTDSTANPENKYKDLSPKDQQNLNKIEQLPVEEQQIIRWSKFGMDTAESKKFGVPEEVKLSVPDIIKYLASDKYNTPDKVFQAIRAIENKLYNPHIQHTGTLETSRQKPMKPIAGNHKQSIQTIRGQALAKLREHRINEMGTVGQHATIERLLNENTSQSVKKASYLISQLDPDVRNATKIKVDPTKGGETIYGSSGKELKEQTKYQWSRFASVLKSIKDDVHGLFSPGTMTIASKIAGGDFKERTARLAHQAMAINEVLKDFRTEMDRPDVPLATAYEFINRMETGKKQATPELQTVADFMRRQLDQRLKEIQGLNIGLLEEYVENYFPHTWEKGPARDTFIKDMLSHKTLEGRKDFLKERTVESFAKGIEKGLIPISNNPVDLFVAKTFQMDKFLMGHKLIKDWSNLGYIQTIKPDDRVPEGFLPIKDKIAIMTEKMPNGEVHITGQYFAPKEVANIINNYLDPGLRDKKWFRSYLGASNLLNQFQLGLSFFHLGFTSMDATISKFALGVIKVSRGDYASGLKDMAHAPLAPWENYHRGNELLKAYKEIDIKDPMMKSIVEALISGGGRAQQDEIYKTQIGKQMNRAFKEGNIIGGILRSPYAAVESVSSLIMDKLVPRQKLGVFMDLAKYELQKNPNMSPELMREKMGKIWESVDNRMGQMVYDNQLWNKTFKDLAMASVRSLGWNIGTFSEIGGGLTDIIKQGGKLSRKDQMELTYRASYVMALPIVAGIYGMMTQFLCTGKGPDELKDYFFPKNGMLDSNGNPQRIMIPSYIKDVYHFTTDTKQTLLNKIHPALAMVGEMLNNKDFYGKEIHHEGDPLFTQLLGMTEHVAKGFMPFSFRNFDKQKELGASTMQLALPFVGITTAPSDLAKSPAQLEITKILRGKIPSEAKTQEQADRSDAKRLLYHAFATKDPEARQKLQEAKQDGTITANDYKQILKEKDLPTIKRSLGHLSLEESLRVYNVANEQEQAEMTPIIKTKIKHFWATATEADKEKIKPEIKKFKGGA